VKIKKWKSFRIGGVFLFNERDLNLVQIFRDINIDWDNGVKGVCERLGRIMVNDVIHKANDFRQLTMEKFEEAVKSYGPRIARSGYFEVICL
jgi:hypothetical protein